ncbi:DUF294 nucleotidyltransferase-like domain-containing protein [Cytobacillus sp. Hz8]|uniref:DUF294 nucleotidyltransferase-like domain-containing protein n=1 Tax=Cytobacillus sp. Hz8 TaxID=3347168 RepID=UPI0035DF47B2
MAAADHLDRGELEEPIDDYKALRKWRNHRIQLVWDDPIALNQFHDELIEATVQKAIKNVESELGPAPAHFTFFLMGSGGRLEQSIWSDQDHGIIFSGKEEMKFYFLQLGTEISQGLSEVGYPFCDGKVMSSNPKWCNSLEAWEKQIYDWLDEASWESLRYFSTFFDSRVLLGSESRLIKLKEGAFKILKENPFLLTRLLENISHIRKGLGVLGQLLPNTSGKEAGSINMKEVVLFPYVNSLRLLSLKEEILAPSTLERFRFLPESYYHIKDYQSSFEKLLRLRLYHKKKAENYENVHFLNIHSLSKSEKLEIKEIMKNGYKLFEETKEIIQKGCSSWT